MANVLFSRTDSPSTKPITDGQIIFDTSGNGKMYLDNGTTRLEMGGAINVDATLDATSTNPIQNKGVAGVMLSELEEVRGVTKKGFLTDALATKTLDAKIGTTDISSIGDGTVTGAISDVNGKLDLSSSELLTTITSQKEQKYNINFTPYIKILIRFTAGHIEDIIIDMSVVKVVGRIWFRRYYNSAAGSNYYYAIGGYVENEYIYIQTCASSGWAFSDIKIYGLK